MTDEELIARLRGWAKDIQEGSKAIWAMDQDLKEAADRIEALIAERDAAEHLARMRKAFIEEARDERDAAEAKAAALEAHIDATDAAWCARIAALTAQVERMRYAIAVVVYQVDDTGEFTEAAMRGLREALRAAITEEPK